MINISEYTEEESPFKEIIKSRLADLNELGFTEKSKGLFVLNNYSISMYYIANESVNGWLYYIEKVKTYIKEVKINKIVRTCFNCKLSTVCFAFRELKTVLVVLPSNIDSDDTPMNQKDVFKALAGCCLVYEENI